jgi:hypothetical protein
MADMLGLLELVGACGLDQAERLPGRGTLGYNWQSGAIVYGVEGDFDWSERQGPASPARVS